MTREEALKIIRDMAYLSAHIVDSGVEAYEFIEQSLSQPQLPSNLDEAAEETAKGLYLDRHNLIWMFKAGAKWMAGQRRIEN